MITKYFSKVAVRFNPFGKEGMHHYNDCLQGATSVPIFRKEMGALY